MVQHDDSSEECARELARLNDEIVDLFAKNERLKGTLHSWVEAGKASHKEAERLTEIWRAVLDYDHHNLQCGYDWTDSMVDPAYCDDAIEEEEMATDALNRAVQLARQFGKEAVEKDTTP